MRIFSGLTPISANFNLGSSCNQSNLKGASMKRKNILKFVVAAAVLAAVGSAVYAQA